MGLCTSWFQISTLTRTTLNSGSVRVERSEGNVNKPSNRCDCGKVEFGKKKKACSQQEVWVSCRGERVLVLCSHVKHLKQRRHKAESSARKQQQHPALSVSPRNLIIIIIKPDFSVGPEGITRSHKSCSLSGIHSLLFFFSQWNILKSIKEISPSCLVWTKSFLEQLRQKIKVVR